MSILNVNQIQPVGGGNTITVSASDVSASGATITASSFVGPVTGNVTGNVTSSSTSTFSSGINVTGGSVGIGTDNPQDILHLYGTATNFTALAAIESSAQNDGILQISGPNIFSAAGVDHLDLGQNADGATVTADSTGSGSNHLIFQSTLNGITEERLRITSDGKMGLGIVSPTGQFAVSDGTRIAEINPHSSGTFIGNRSNHDVLFQINAATKAKIDTSGNLTVSNGNLVIGTTGKGIDFSATDDGTGSTSELLDDYEEGTFTPTAFLGNTAQTVTTATGTYTKVGNTVFFSCRLEGITKSGTGELSIGGLPYTPLFTGNANKYNQPTVRYNGINPGGVLVPLFSPSGSRFIFFQGISTSGVLGGITDSAASSTYNIFGLSGFYTV